MPRDHHNSSSPESKSHRLAQQHDRVNNAESLVPSKSQQNKKNVRSTSSAKNNQPQNGTKPNFLSLLKRRWPTVLGVTLGFTVAMMWWTQRQSPIYQGKFMLLLEKQTFLDQNLQLEDDDSLNNSNLNPQVDYSTEIQILASASVLAPVLEEIAQEYPEIYQDINLTDLEDLEIRQVDKTKIIEVVFRDENPEKVKFVLDKISQSYLDENTNPLQSTISDGLKFVRSQTALLENQVNSLQNKLQNLRQKYQLVDPKVTAQQLIQQSVAVQKEYFEVDTQLQQAKDIYTDLQNRLKLSPDQAIAVTSLTESPRYQTLLKQLQDIDIKIAEQTAVYTNESPVVIDLREKRVNIINLLEEESNKFSVKSPRIDPNNPNNVVLNTPSKIRTQQTEELIKKEQEIKSLTTRANKLKEIAAELNQKIAKMPEVTRDYSDLERELEVSGDSLTRLLKTQEQLEIQNAQNKVNWKVIAPPQLDENPILPFPAYNLVLIVLGGLSLGTISAIFVDRLDHSIYSVAQLRQVTSVPILGYIPFYRKIKVWKKSISTLQQTKKQKDFPSFTSSNQNTLLDKSSSNWNESFRNLYTNLHFLDPDKITNSVVVSSSNPAEGKSTVSLNLARTAAAMGKKVLLVDTDLRLPQVHRLLGLENSYGLTDVLDGKMELFSTIQKIPQWDNLSVITSGQLSGDVTRLLLHARMAETIENLSASQQFDLIIYDTPPLLGFADAKIIATHTDGLILVVKLVKSQDKALKQALEQLNVANVPFLGMVVNNVTQKQNFAYQADCHDYYRAQISKEKKAQL